MKKTFRIRMTIIAIIVICVIAIGIYQLIKIKNKQYEIEKITEYNYFVLKQDNLYGVINRNGDIMIKKKQS